MPRPISYAVFCLKKKKEERCFDYALRLAAHAAGPVVLGQPERNLRRGLEDQQRIATGDEVDRTYTKRPTDHLYSRSHQALDFEFLIELNRDCGERSFKDAIFFSFFFNDTATTDIYTLSLHDALPISALTGRSTPLIMFSV